MDTKRPLKLDDFEGEFLKGNSTADNHHDPSEEVLDAGRDTELHRSSNREQQDDSTSLQETISCPLQDGDSPLDVHDRVETRPSDSDSHNHFGGERGVSSMPELPELPSKRDLPSLLCALKNDRFGFHPDTSDNLLKEYDLEDINEMCPHPLTGCRLVFADRLGFTIWIVDNSGIMYQYCRMDSSMKLMGHDMVEGLINYLYYPDRLLWLWPNTQEWILKEEYERRADEEMKGVTYESLGICEFPDQIARGKPKPKKKRGKKHKR